jgi:hypothetical protein
MLQNVVVEQQKYRASVESADEGEYECLTHPSYSVLFIHAVL